jgi:hypothetical protein
MIDLPFFSKILSSLDLAAFGYGAEIAVSPVLKTISSLSRVISSPTSSTKERRTAGRLLQRALDKTTRLPRYPAKIELPLEPVGVAMFGVKMPEGLPSRPIHGGRDVPLIVGTKTPVRQMAKASSSNNSARPFQLQTGQRTVASRRVQRGGVSPAPVPLNNP